MKQYRYEEFIKFSKEFQRGRHDFYGEYSPLSDGEKKAFFHRGSAMYPFIFRRKEERRCSIFLQVRCLVWLCFFSL